MKTVVITGAGSGLGRAIAKQYASQDHQVILLGRTEEKLALVKKDIIAQGGAADCFVCDVTEPASVEEALKQIDAIDILINNAGIGIFGELSTYQVEDIETMLDTNVKGTILMTKASLPLLQQSNGKVLNIISTAGLRGKVKESVYCASKFALCGFTESLQKEWETSATTATAVYMGGMNTPFWKDNNHVTNPEQLKGPEQVAEQMYREDDGRAEIIIDS
ncbi:SDR family oxidoreductase [Thalassobacillus sp. CUG 92003]|uniref:SDR family NAD(P)-dependent oxidoreductase n=1 Tax=Thalassobacillus sp. CUG 92003 TaxID=2736641 RepID=UPI0015E70498|nr:SDR family oxidoreductase [Thalassobacillus sp. CUG 92003]